MLVGLTYDLKDYYLAKGYDYADIVEFDSLETINEIDSALKTLGYQTERIGNVENLLNKIVANNRWDLVFNIAEGLGGMGREAQIPAILEAFNLPYTFSTPDVLSVCLNKVITKRIIRDIGVPTPSFKLIRTVDDVHAIDIDFPVFIKPLAEGTSKGISDSAIAASQEELEKTSPILLEKFKQPLLVEKYLPGRELTVGLMENSGSASVIGTMEIVINSKSPHQYYSHHVKANYQDFVEYRPADSRLASKCQEMSLVIWETLGCRDAARVDFRCDENGEPSFLEINPLPGLNPNDSDLPIICRLRGIKYMDLIGAIMKSAGSRITKK